MDDFVESVGAPGMGPYSPIKPLGKNSACTGACVAEKPPRLQRYLRPPASDREVGQFTQISAMNTASHRTAKRTRTRACRRPDRHHDPLRANLEVFDGEARWDKF
jgi:hypothetical protein